MSKKKLLVLSNSPHLYQGAGGRTRIVHELHEILRGEADVRLLCLVPLKYYLHPVGLRAARKQLEADAGTPVVYRPTIPTFQGRLSKLALWLNAFALWVHIALHGCRRVHAQGISTAFPVIFLKKRGSSIRLLTDVHGVLPEEQRYERAALGGARFQEMSRKEKEVLENSDLVFLVSNRLREHYEGKYGLCLDNSLVVPCLTADEPVAPRQGTVSRPAKISHIPADRILFTYSGSYRKYQLVDETFQVFSMIKEKLPAAFFLILTNQPNVFEATARETGVATEDYQIVSLARDEVPHYLAAADCGFLLRDDSVVNKVASPTKFAEYLAAGLPVITTETVGDYSAIVQAHDVGYAIANIANPGAGLFAFIERYLADKEVIRARARGVAAGLTWASHKREILETMAKYDFI